MKKVSYKGWKNCYRLSNDVIDLVVTTDVGPRIIRLGFADGDNEFKEYEDQIGTSGADEWRIYGGHRLWHAPESLPRTCSPDNSPIRIEKQGDGLRVIQETEKTTGIQKEIDVALDPTGAHAKVTHRLRNNNLWTVELAPWSLSVMAAGGRAIIPLPPRTTHGENLLPTGVAVLWAYTDMSDPRWTWGHRYVMLQQDPEAKTPQKAGFSVPLGWAAYARERHLFVKTYDHDADASYEDMGCNFETYTDGAMLEVETLGPRTSLQPGAEVEHVEDWYLLKDVPTPQNDDDVDKHVLPRIAAIKT